MTPSPAERADARPPPETAMERSPLAMELIHVNPSTLAANPAFSQGVLVRNPGAMLYVGGQNGLGPDGTLVSDDVAAQTQQALRNVLEVLRSAGASQEQVVKLTISLVQGQDVRAAFAASQAVWGSHATTVSVLVVAGLAVPGALVEVDAVCALEH
jgi:2-iminobutanoate/2-iminopropanoate deaminase